MENNISVLVVLLLFVVVVFKVFSFYSKKKKRKDKACLQNFLIFFAENFHEIRWEYFYLHHGDGLTDKEIAKKITEILRKMLEHKFQFLFVSLSSFPADIFPLRILDGPSYRFVEKLFPTIKSLFIDYKDDDIIINEAINNFFVKIEEIIITELAKDNKLNFTKE